MSGNGPPVRCRAEILRDEMIQKDRIAALLREGPKTIPAIAGALGCPSHEVVCWLMAMRRYGAVEEKGKADADGYYSYVLTEKGNETAQAGEGAGA